MECINVLKRSQRSSTQQQFNVNSEHLLVAAIFSTALSRFGVVLSRIPRCLKVCTCSITSPSNTNSWHGLAKLNTMTFVFFTFTISPCSTLQEASLYLEASQHLPQHFTWHSIERLFEVHKATMGWLIFCLILFYQSSQYEELVNNAIIFVKPSLTFGM